MDITEFKAFICVTHDLTILEVESFEWSDEESLKKDLEAYFNEKGEKKSKLELMHQILLLKDRLSFTKDNIKFK